MKQAGYALLLLFFACHVQVARSEMQVGVYYYPWHTGSSFHGGNPPGSTTLVYHLDPQQTPELGWYDQYDPSVISQHYEWARYAGIKFFACSYWGRSSTTNTVIKNYMFDNPDRGDIKLCVFLEPRITPAGNDPDKPEDDITEAEITTETNYLCDNYFNRPGYFRIDGKPVIFIYVTRAMSDSELTMCISTIRAAATNKGIGDVYIVGDEVWGSPNVSVKTPRVSQMDAISNYDVYGNLGRARFVTDSILDTWQSRNTLWKDLADSLGKQFIPAVSPGFNDRGVREGHQPSSRKLNNASNAFGTLFSGMLDRVTADMIMVTSWNEWHEDTQIEPVAAAAPTNIDDGATSGYYTGYYTDDLYYNGYGTLYLDILREYTCSIEGDLNEDCYVDYLDFADLRAGWLTTYGMSDLLLIVQNWLGASEAIAYWRLDETAGAVASDSSVNGYNGTLMNMDDSDWVPGVSGNALEFDGGDEYVEVIGYKGITGTGSRTCAAWIKTNQAADIISWGDNAVGRKWIVRVNASGNLDLGIWDGYKKTTQTVNDDEWHHVAVVMPNDGNPDISEVQLYIDGILQTDSVASNSQAISTAGVENVTIGARKDDGILYNPLNGLIDDVRIYNRALSESEIATLVEMGD